ncbi:glucose 1-dehydrogenase [bacterium A37T11]|nr:glucose 1-dehydrogenase [bacterium A37T11]
MSLNKQYEGKSVMISGGLGDIGTAIAVALGSEGAHIALSDIFSEKEALKKLQVLTERGISFEYRQVNIKDSQAVDDWLVSLPANKELVLAVANAATVTLKSYQRLSADDWFNEIDVNLNGSYYLASTACRYFVANKIKGNVVFLGSWAAHRVHAHIPAYSVSKAAIRMLCKSMALEYASYGIRVNEIAPGYVNAGLSKEVWKKDKGLAAEARNKVPVKALIEASEVAKQLLWICDQDNKHVTGSTILMDGGLSLLS